MKRTPLYEAHLRLGGKLVEFGGFAMPLQYSSIIEEHKTVRTSVGIFDVSHMGEIKIWGRDALALLQKLITNDASALQEYQVLYSPICYESGGTVDDLLIYRLPDCYLLVVNAANTDKDFAWIEKNATGFSEVQVRNASTDYGQIAVQGPESERLLQRFVEYDLQRLRYYWSAKAPVLGTEALVSRTGYTGEDGFEIYGSSDLTVRLWGELLSAGGRPVGLGARDTLRFEASYPLYGHELSEEISPIEGGLGWTVKEKTVDYNGKKILLEQKRRGAPRKLIGLKMLESGVPRQGHKIFSAGSEVGRVTSGMLAPTLKEFLAMGLVDASLFRKGEEVAIEIRGERKRAQWAKLPFYPSRAKR